ncbi:MAG: metallophosphoesterase [Phycisphaerales bacterium]
MLVLLHVFSAPLFAGFRVRPYLLNPEPGKATVVWFSDSSEPGQLILEINGGFETYVTTPEPAQALAYHETEVGNLPQGAALQAPFRHVVQLKNLHPGGTHLYVVHQDGDVYDNLLTAGPRHDQKVRFIVFADSETEPESTGKPTGWAEPGVVDSERVYLVDQTEGFKQNLLVIKSRKPGFLAFAGDIVESGGEQRDWDELWRHLSGDLGDIGASTPIVAAPGNHDAYGGPKDFGGFGTDASRRAEAKFRTYFTTTTDPNHPPQGYHRLDYGPITLISIDSTNGLPDNTDHDTNWLLTGRDAEHDFNPGSAQYRWLEAQLADAQQHSAFTFVQFHHVPYSVGPHGFVPGSQGHDHGQDNQSGVPMRALTDLFMRYGVDAVFAGHDEMYEHSLIPDGIEQLPGEDNRTRPHSLHVYDVGIAGDGLRGPYFGPGGAHDGHEGNPYQAFLAHNDAPEVWDGPRLVSGGKHYGHLEVNVTRDDAGLWRAVLTPVYVFPLMDEQGVITGWERRVYDDEVTLTGPSATP